MVEPALSPVDANQNDQALAGQQNPKEAAAEAEQGLAVAVGNHALEGAGGNAGPAAAPEAQYKYLGWGKPAATPPRLSEYNTQLHKGSMSVPQYSRLLVITCTSCISCSGANGCLREQMISIALFTTTFCDA